MFICDEIINKLEELSLTVDDVEFISMEVKKDTDQYTIFTWEEFQSMYPRFFYDNGLGSQEINPTLTIYTKNYIFYRREYDGGEWFESVPTKENILNKSSADHNKNYIHAEVYYGMHDEDYNFDGGF